MGTWTKALGEGVAKVIIVAFLSVFGGTIIWLIWPVGIKSFPRLVSIGYIAESLSWWQSVCLVWMTNILIKRIDLNKSDKTA